MPALVEQIFLASVGGEPMRSVAEVEAIVGEGLRGDRYARHVGYWSGIDECEVTLIEAEALEDVLRATGVQVMQGQHRRNIVTRGLVLRELQGKRFTIGTAVFEYDRPRPPCRYIESLSEPGMTRSLSGGRGGICVRVATSGLLRIGDEIKLVSNEDSPL